MNTREVFERVLGALVNAGTLIRIREDELDLEYILGWVRDLGLEEEWAAACRAAARR